jgi:hypothetical protein
VRIVRSISEQTVLASVAPRARQVLLVTQAFFYLTLFVCVAINHGPAAQTDGISFYGVYHSTILILVAGFAVSATGLWRAAALFAETDAPILIRRAMRVVAVGLVALLVTPFNRGAWLNWTHMGVGVAIALVQASITLVLMSEHRSTGVLVGFAVQLAGGLLAAASLPDWHFPYLLQGETLYQIGFGWCLVEWTWALRARQVHFLSEPAGGPRI